MTNETTIMKLFTKMILATAIAATPYFASAESTLDATQLPAGKILIKTRADQTYCYCVNGFQYCEYGTTFVPTSETCAK